MTPELKAQEDRERIDEAKKYQDALGNIREILNSKAGKGFMKYLFENLEVGELPAKGLEGIDLAETIGFLRAGKSVFEIVSDASPKIASDLFTDIVKERYAKKITSSI